MYKDKEQLDLVTHSEEDVENWKASLLRAGVYPQINLSADKSNSPVRGRGREEGGRREGGSEGVRMEGGEREGGRREGLGFRSMLVLHHISSLLPFYSPQPSSPCRTQSSDPSIPSWRDRSRPSVIWWTLTSE